MPAPIINGITHTATEPVGPGDTFEVTIDAVGVTDQLFQGAASNALNEGVTADITIQFRSVLNYGLTAPGSTAQIVPKPGVPGTFEVTIP